MLVKNTLSYCAALGFLVIATAPVDARPTHCILEVAGKTYISGPCDYRPLKDAGGDFQVTGADGRHFAYVYVEAPDRATAHWNGELGENRAHDPLGALRREDGCWVNDTARICVSTVTASAAGNTAPHGAWDCGKVMGFTLDASTYTVNGKGNSVAQVEQIAEDTFGITLADDYRFALFDVTPSTLTWHSPQSGDTFECRRQK